jgi:hypothetical protein
VVCVANVVTNVIGGMAGITVSDVGDRFPCFPNLRFNAITFSALVTRFDRRTKAPTLLGHIALTNYGIVGGSMTMIEG